MRIRWYLKWYRTFLLWLIVDNAASFPSLRGQGHSAVWISPRMPQSFNVTEQSHTWHCRMHSYCPSIAVDHHTLILQYVRSTFRRARQFHHNNDFSLPRAEMSMKFCDGNMPWMGNPCARKKTFVKTWVVPRPGRAIISSMVDMTTIGIDHVVTSILYDAEPNNLHTRDSLEIDVESWSKFVNGQF